MGKKKSVTFGFLTERVQSKLKGWKEKTLSMGGKEILIRAVAEAVPTYAMSCFALPLGTCEKMEQSIRQFWWTNSKKDRGMCWKSWDHMKLPKPLGGVGFRDIKAFNKALLARQGWRLITNPNTLLARVYKSKYYPNTDFLNASPGSNASFAWNSLLKGREVLQKGVMWNLGDGRTAKVLKDSWIDRPNNPKITSVCDLSEQLTVRELFSEATGDWNKQFIENHFNWYDADSIYKMQTPTDGEDRLYWRFTANGQYTVNSGYKIFYMKDFEENAGMSSSGSNIFTQAMKNLWKMKMPSKIRHFLWRSIHQTLPTNNNLCSRGINVPNLCSFCKEATESETHLFKYCDFAKKVLSIIFEPQIYSTGTADFSSWAVEFLVDHREGDREKFAVTLWALWWFRNWKVHEKEEVSPEFAANFIEEKLALFRSFIAPLHQRPAPRDPELARWKLPPDGFHLVSSDGAWNRLTNKGGAGFVIRNQQGEAIAAASITIPGCRSAREAESTGVASALEKLTELGLTKAIIQVDDMGLQRDLQKMCEDGFITDRTRNGRVMERCLESSRAFSQLDFRFIVREMNPAADGLAKGARDSGVSFVWGNGKPPWVLSLLEKESDCISSDTD